MVIGFFTLVMFFLPSLPMGQTEDVLLVRAHWMELAVVIVAFGMILGMPNLLLVHWGRVIHLRRGWFFSLVTFLSAWVVMGISAWDVAMAWPGRLEMLSAQGVAGPGMTWVYQFVLYPLQSSFTALLAFLLAFAAYRTLRLRRGIGALLFLGAALIVLTVQAVSGMAYLPGMGIVMWVHDRLVNVWATAGLRGVLLGIALGTLATATRVLIGFDRPASE